MQRFLSRSFSLLARTPGTTVSPTARFSAAALQHRSLSSKGTIKEITAREILDSRGNPTVEVDVITQQGMFRASVPSGASTGVHEAVELRDNDQLRYRGKGVIKAVEQVNTILAPKLKGMDAAKQKELDQAMCDIDGTPNKAKLGANSILGVSIAACRAGAAANGLPLFEHIGSLAENSNFVLPVPSFNVINGGKHAGNVLAPQEFMLMPVHASSFRQALQMGQETFRTLQGIVRTRYGLSAVNVGDEGGVAPAISDMKEALELIHMAILNSGYDGSMKMALDLAASEFFLDDKYDLNFKTEIKGLKLTSATELTEVLNEMVSQYPIVSIEDPFYEEDFESHGQLRAKIGDRVQIVGDDLLCTNPIRIQTAIDKKSVNALLLKPNQIGTVSESIQAYKLARSGGWAVMVSHRSGDTEDAFIADLAVGLGSGQIKTGGPCRSERLAKYNQLLRIEEYLGKNAKYAGADMRSP